METIQEVVNHLKDLTREEGFPEACEVTVVHYPAMFCLLLAPIGSSQLRELFRDRFYFGTHLLRTYVLALTIVARALISLLLLVAFLYICPLTDDLLESFEFFSNDLCWTPSAAAR